MGLVVRAALLLAAASGAAARIHHLKIYRDTRFAFSIESFGFESGGEMEIKVSNIESIPSGVPHKMGFVLFPAQSDSNVAADIDSLITKGQCALDFANGQNIYVIDTSDTSKWAEGFSEKLTVDGAGMFDLAFTRCEPAESSVSFTLDYTFRNPGPNYLSAGEMPLPIVYGVLTAAFTAAAVAWFVHARRNAGDVQKIHWLMSLLLVTKTASLLFEALMYKAIAVYGHSTGWNVGYYIFAFAKGCLLVVVIALVGAGWSLLKPFLSDREKKVLMVVLPLQVLNQIALIITDEMDPGSLPYAAWVNVLHFADVFASAVILAPIIWQIKSLREAQAADRGDEKAKDTLIRLTQFRSFYLLTLGWLYFTRIVVYLLAASIAWDRQWMAPLIGETVTLAYYVWSGYRFRPAPDNSDYLRVPQDDDGPPSAVGDGLELTGARAGASAPAAAGAGSGGDAEAAQGRTSAASVRAKAAPAQTVARTGVSAEAAKFAASAAAGGATSDPAGSGSGSGSAEDEGEGHHAATAAAASSKVVIADDEDDDGGAAGGRAGGAGSRHDDDEDDFGLDEDDLKFELGVKGKPAAAAHAGAAAAAAPASGGKLKNLRAARGDD